MPMESLQRGASVDSFKECKVSKIPLPQFLTQGLSSSQFSLFAELGYRSVLYIIFLCYISFGRGENFMAKRKVFVIVIFNTI